MSLDASREALHRIARELRVPTAEDPARIATEVIRHMQRREAHFTDLACALEQANRRLEILEGSVP